MTEIGTDWRLVDGVATAWFDAPSLIEGAALAGRIVELPAEIVVDLRATGIRVRLDSDEHAEAVSAAARDLGLAANPAVLQHLSVAFESANPSVVRRFWQRVLDYALGEDGGLVDPLRRDPAIRIRQSTEPRPLRNRIHIDVVVRPEKPAEAEPFRVTARIVNEGDIDLVLDRIEESAERQEGGFRPVEGKGPVTVSVGGLSEIYRYEGALVAGATYRKDLRVIDRFGDSWRTSVRIVPCE